MKFAFRKIAKNIDLRQKIRKTKLKTTLKSFGANVESKLSRIQKQQENMYF